MSELKLRPEVRAFAEAMERKLRANDHKDHWRNSDIGYLEERLWDEVYELNEVLGQRSVVLTKDETELGPRILTEAVDVANYAMMIADFCRALKLRTQ